MSDFRQTFNDQGFAVGQFVASHYLTNDIIMFKVAEIRALSDEDFVVHSWKKANLGMQEGDVILGLAFMDDPNRVIYKAPKYHQVVPFPEQKVA